MTNIDIILAVGLLIALVVAAISIGSFMLMRNEVDTYRFETQALTQAYESFKKHDEDNNALMNNLHNLLDNVLDHDRRVIDDNTRMLADMAKLQATTEALHDDIRHGVRSEVERSDSEPSG